MIEERLLAHSLYDSETDCQNWTGALRDGYGVVWHKGHLVSAHRLAWELHNHEIPKGVQVLHKCDNRKCINPAHLCIGSQKDNTQDAISKGRYDPVAYGKMASKVRNEKGQFIKSATQKSC